MNDPLNTTTPSTTDTTGDLSGAQSSINDALASTPPPPTIITTTTTTPALEAAPVLPTPLTMPSTPTPNVIETSTTTKAPSIPSTPLTPPATSAPNVSMGDDTPLAFASLPTSPTATTPITTTTTTVTPPPTSIDSSYVPPLPGVAPTTTTTTTVATATPKKRGKMGKILAMFFGFVLLGATVFGGYWYYDHYLVERATIAAITEKSQCSGCKNGGWLVWRNGQCKVTGICDSGVPGKDTQNPAPTPTAEVSAGAGNTCGAGYFYCGGAINKCVSAGALTAAGGGCNKYGEVVYGIPTVYGANYAPVAFNAACPAGFPKKCNCGGDTTVCFDKTGICDQSDATAQGAAGTNYNTQGLCAVAGSYSGENFTLNTTNTANYTCTNSGCTSNVGSCTTIRYTCKSTVGGNSCTNTSSTFQNATTPSTSTSFAGKCGTVEQVDVMCNGVYTASRTQINPACKTTTTDTTATMACTGITRTPTTEPVIGGKVTFTCAGTVTPSTAGTLSYKFRYSLNSGTLTPLANKTATTAELTIAACGSYSVQCQACATLNGVLTCDPTWIGATTQ